VSRVASPPAADTFHTSPRHVKAISRPSGLIDGYRGRSTLPGAASAVGPHAVAATTAQAIDGTEREGRGRDADIGSSNPAMGGNG
jgi:hypothetical protein